MYNLQRWGGEDGRQEYSIVSRNHMVTGHGSASADFSILHMLLFLAPSRVLKQLRTMGVKPQQGAPPLHVLEVRSS